MVKEVFVSQFNAYFVDSLNVFNYLSQSQDTRNCVVIGESNLPTILSNGSLEQILVKNTTATLVASNIAWPQGLERIVITAPIITRELFVECCNFIAPSLLAMLPIQQSLGCQSIELLANDHIKLDQLASIVAKYQGDANTVRHLPNLNQPGLVVLDMDSTSIEIECIDEIAKLAGVGDEVAEITELAMQGQLDFAQSLRARVAKLKGVKLSLLDVIANDLPLMSGMRELAQQFQSYGWKVAIASGGFTYFADNLKQQLSLDEAISNVLEVKDGHLTGELVGKIVDAQVKADTVLGLAKKYQIDLSQTIAIGDGANDLKMMEVAALGIAFRAKPLVQQQASVAITQGDLSTVIALLTR